MTNLQIFEIFVLIIFVTLDDNASGIGVSAEQKEQVNLIIDSLLDGEPLHIFWITTPQNMVLKDKNRVFSSQECYVVIERENDFESGVLWYIYYILGDKAPDTTRIETAETAIQVYAKLKNKNRAIIYRAFGVFEDNATTVGQIKSYLQLVGNMHVSDLCDLYMISGSGREDSFTIKLEGCKVKHTPSEFEGRKAKYSSSDSSTESPSSKETDSDSDSDSDWGFPFYKKNPFGKGFRFHKHTPFEKGFPFHKHNPFEKGFPFHKHNPFENGFPFHKHNPFEKGFPDGTNPTSPFFNTRRWFYSEDGNQGPSDSRTQSRSESPRQPQAQHEPELQTENDPENISTQPVNGESLKYCLVLRVFEPTLKVHFSCSVGINNNTSMAMTTLVNQLSLGINDSKIPHSSLEEVQRAIANILESETKFQEALINAHEAVVDRVTPLYEIYAGQEYADVHEPPIMYNKLRSDACYLLNTKSMLGVYLWLGLASSVETQIEGVRYLEEYFTKNKVPASTAVTILEEGNEITDFKISFTNWHNDFRQ